MSPKCTPKSAKNQPIPNFGLIVFWAHFWHRFLIKHGSKKRPKNRARDDLYRARDDLLTTCLVLSSVSDFLEPQGPILGSFGLHFEAPELHFRINLDLFWVFKCFNLEPCTSDTYSFCLTVSPFGCLLFVGLCLSVSVCVSASVCLSVCVYLSVCLPRDVFSYMWIQSGYLHCGLYNFLSKHKRIIHHQKAILIQAVRISEASSLPTVPANRRSRINLFVPEPSQTRAAVTTSPTAF